MRGYQGYKTTKEYRTRSSTITKLSNYSFQRAAVQVSRKTRNSMATKAIGASKATKSRQPRLSRPPRLPEVPRLQGYFSKARRYHD